MMCLTSLKLESASLKKSYSIAISISMLQEGYTKYNISRVAIAFILIDQGLPTNALYLKIHMNFMNVLSPSTMLACRLSLFCVLLSI